MQDTFDIHKWKTYQMFLNESDDDFEFTDTDKDLAAGLNTVELKVGDYITPDMWKDSITSNLNTREYFKHLTSVPRKIKRTQYFENDGFYWWLEDFNAEFKNNSLKPEFKVISDLDEQDDDFEFTDTDKDLASYLNIDDELKVGSIIIPQMWDKEALEGAINYLKIGEDSKDTLKQYEKFLKEPHTISGLFKSELVPDSKDYYKIVFTNGSVIHSSYLKPEFNTFKSLSESDDDFEFTDTDKNLAADLGIKELTIGDTIMPNMWIDVFEKGETFKKYQIKSLKSSPHKITNIEVIGDDRVLMFGEIDDYYYTNDFLKPQYRVVLPDDMFESEDDFEFTDTDKNLAASMYADQIVAKYDVIIDIDQDVDIRLRKPLTDDFILKLLKRPLSLENTSIECTISVSNKVALSDLLNYLNISEDVYSQWVTSDLKLDTELAEENLNDLVDETISTHVHSLWDDNFEEGNFQINNVVIDYSEMPDDVLKLAKSDTFRKALNKSVIEQIMSPDFYSGGQENVFADYVHYDWNVRVVPNTLSEADDFEFTDIDKDLATGLNIKELTIGDIITPDMINVPQDKRTWNNWHKILGDPKRKGWKINSFIDDGRVVYLKTDSIIHPFEIDKINSVLKPSYKIFPPDDLAEQDDDFEFTSTDKDLASSLADDVILEPGYVFNGDEIKDDKALRARLIGKTITRYYTRKSPLLNSRDQIMMDIKDVSGKEIQYVLSKLKPNYFIPDEVYNLKLGEEYK
jgi:hypothetical protein